ncbi:MAG: hypothetical protein AAGB26_01365 [Planctomycetota bacterium]
MHDDSPLAYLDPACKMTLREGIQELRQAEGADDDATETLAPELAGDIEIHDAIHVLFACTTDLEGEVRAHVWTIFGTTAKLADLHRVMSHRDHREVIRQIGHVRLLLRWLFSVPRIVKLVWYASRMKNRWPVTELDSFLDRPLDEIRQQFRIQLPPPSSSTRSQRGGAGLRTLNSRPAST